MKAATTLFLLAALSLAATLTAARADTIELQDGRKLSGTVSRQGNQATIKTDDGQTITAPWADIVRVVLSGPTDPSAAPGGASPDMAKSEWTRIAAQIKTAPDLAAIITLHQKFLEKYPDSPLTPQVKDSLGVYQQLSTANAVKFRGKWLSPDQVDVTTRQWTEAAKVALIYYQAGQMKQALDAAKTVLAKDDQNPDALTLAGLAAYRTSNYALARRYFTTLSDSDPANGLAQNNLAVIGNQQKQVGETLIHYTKALQLIATNRLLLDNVAEAINSYKKSGADQNSANFRNLVAAYTVAEAAMETQMAKQGLHRFGAGWATKEEMAAAAKNVQEVRAQMAQLEAQYKANQDAMTALDARINQANQDVTNADTALMVAAAQVQQMTRTTSAYGNGVTTGINSYQYQVQNMTDPAQQNYNAAKDRRDALVTQKNTLLGRQKDFFTQADGLKTQLANADNPFTGEQHVMELADLENPPAAPPATAPAK